jgi:DNA polymerase-3 subunit gamma/tau
MSSYLVLARKYRPATFSDVIGQDHVVQALTNSIVSGRVAHAFLFSGVRGVGKTTVARILAKALNCRERPPDQADPCGKCSSCLEIRDGISVDVQEIDGASHTSVENVREINENIKYPPVSSPYKIIIIDEVHMISINAFNALLKTLEEPPPHAKFIFATTEAHKVPATITSRCQRFNFRTVSVKEMVDTMTRILTREGQKASAEALALIAREAQGSFRDALSLLDQVIAYGSGEITAEAVGTVLGIAGRETFAHLMEATVNGEASIGLRLVHDLFEQGFDPEQLVLDMIQYLRGLIVIRTVPATDRPEGMVDASPAELEEMEKLATRVPSRQLHYLLEMLLRSESEIKRAANPWVALEMAVLRMAHAPDIVDLSEIIRRIDAKQAGTIQTVPPARGAGDWATQTARPEEPVSRGRKSKPSPDDAPPEKPYEPEALPAEKEPTEGFVITRITPVPDGAPDEVWATIKKEIMNSGADPALPSVMDHGSLISVSPKEAEVGFHKSFYKEQFENCLASNPAVGKIFEDFLGPVRLKILVLAEETPLAPGNPYAAPSNGESDRNRALKQEALDHPIVRAVQREFQDSTIEEIKILG